MPAPLRRESGPTRLAFLLLAAVSPLFLHAQLTTGVVEGVLRGPDGRAKSAAQIVIAGSLQFRAVTQTTADGEFTRGAALWRVSVRHRGRCASAVSVVVAAVADHARRSSDRRSGSSARRSAERIARCLVCAPREIEALPEATTLQGLLLNQEPASVTEPLDFTGLRRQPCRPRVAARVLVDRHGIQAVSEWMRPIPISLGVR